MSIRHHTKPAKTPQTEEHENPFSNSVLIGNWFEDRFDNTVDRKAIAPGIYGESQCSQEVTRYRNDFQQPIQSGHRQEYEEFIKCKQQGFSNRLHSEQANLQMWDGDQFANNLTTIKDIMFRIRPNEDAKRIDEPVIKRRVNDDYMRSYGNSTKTGLLHWMHCERRGEDERPIDVSHYKNHFRPIKLTEIKNKTTQRKNNI